MTERMLLAVGDTALSAAISGALVDAGFEVDTFDDGNAGLELARSNEYDLLILDVLFPGVSGLEVVQRLRAQGSDLLIVLLAEPDGEEQGVAGLDLGADGYLVKPPSIPELVVRVRAHLRRREIDRGTATITVGGLELDVAHHSATIDGRPVMLTRSEFRLVALMASKAGEACTREDLVRHLWESEFTGDRRAIDVHVSNLRRKLEHDPRRPKRLVTVRGVGYKLAAV